MRDSHRPEGSRQSPTGADYRRWSNQEMIDRLDLPPITWDGPVDKARLERNLAVDIRRAIFKYLDGYYGEVVPDPKDPWRNHSL